MIGIHGRKISAAIFNPPAVLLNKLHVHPNVITVAGCLLFSGVSWWLVPLGHWWQAAIALFLIGWADSLDGVVARLSGKTSDFGAFLDSTLDRVSDGMVFSAIAFLMFRRQDTLGIVLALLCVVFALTVPYAKAKAESKNLKANVGIAERTDRLLAVAVGGFLIGFGLPFWIMYIVLGLIALASFITILQRLVTVYKQLAALQKNASEDTSTSPLSKIS